MSEPEIKMEKFAEIQDCVKELRILAETLRKENKRNMFVIEKLNDLGIQCLNVTNCVDVGKKCYKCKNNYARRSYFQNLIQRDIDLTVYAGEASCFDAVGGAE